MTLRERLNAPQPPWLVRLDPWVYRAHLLMVGFGFLLATRAIYLHAWKALGWASVSMASFLIRRLMR